MTFRSRIVPFIAAFALAGVLAAPAASAYIETIELAYESNSTDLSLPDAVGSSIQLPGCAAPRCPSSVQLVASSKFYVGTREVSFAKLRERLRSGHYDVTVFYAPKTFVVTRVISN